MLLLRWSESSSRELRKAPREQDAHGGRTGREPLDLAAKDEGPWAGHLRRLEPESGYAAGFIPVLPGHLGRRRADCRAGVVYWFAIRPLPKTSGSITAPIAERATVVRDALGVPHISPARSRMRSSCRASSRPRTDLLRWTACGVWLGPAE